MMIVVKEIVMVPDGLWYTKEHEWVKVEGKLAVMGITNFAQQQLGEITFIELPVAGRKVSAGAELASVESAKAASDVYAPVAGTIAAVNDSLESQPELLNQDCYGKGWICKIEIAGTDAVKGLLSVKDYENYLKGL